jgi:hypothetical protein
MGFRQFLQNDTFWKEQELQMTNIIKDWYLNGTQIISNLGPITVYASTNQYRTLFDIHLNERYEKMYSLINEYLKTFKLSEDLYLDLALLNQSVVAKQRELNDYEISTKYNILEYITDAKFNMNGTLKTVDTIVDVRYPHDPVKSKDLAWFMESIFFARRRSFGKNFLTSKK